MRSPSALVAHPNRLTEDLRGDWKRVDGSAKRTYDKNIEKAHAYWKDYKARSH